MGWVWYHLGQVGTYRLVAEMRAQTQMLEAWIRAKTSPQRIVFRSRICLLASEGIPRNTMAHRWETSRPTMRLWRTGFNEAGPLGSIRRCPAWASAHRLSPRKVRASMEATRQTTPLDAHQIETFKWSKATRCVETLTDVVTAIDEFIRLNYKNPTPFVWT